MSLEIYEGVLYGCKYGQGPEGIPPALNFAVMNGLTVLNGKPLFQTPDIELYASELVKRRGTETFEFLKGEILTTHYDGMVRRIAPFSRGERVFLTRRVTYPTLK
ncbi:MAG: hypothetical protein JW727_00835 [Candidatus Aenigmarchaeota archaeon]|nr:hypothetical protein [Candidatus Aenigmarchaeota archaeon]